MVVGWFVPSFQSVSSSIFCGENLSPCLRSQASYLLYLLRRHINLGASVAPPPFSERIIKLLYFQAYLSLVQEMEWKEYLVLYEDNQGLVRISPLSRLNLSYSFVAIVVSRGNILLVCIDIHIIILCLPLSSGEITRAPQVSVTNKDQQYESLNTTVTTRTGQRLQVSR